MRIAADAVRAAMNRHHFLGVTKSGHSAIVTTTGNPDTHVILRGGTAPNYDAASVDAAVAELDRAGVSAQVMIDCSHANSRKQFKQQLDVASDIAARIARGERRIFGVMVESHLHEGRQDLTPGRALAYGQSITDACLGWDDSVGLLDALAGAVRQRRTLLQASAGLR